MIAHPDTIHTLYVTIVNEETCHLHTDPVEAVKAATRFRSRVSTKSLRGHQITKTGPWTHADIDSHLTVEPLKTFEAMAAICRHL